MPAKAYPLSAYTHKYPRPCVDAEFLTIILSEKFSANEKNGNVAR